MDAADEAEQRPVLRTVRLEDGVLDAGQQLMLEDDRATLDHVGQLTGKRER